MAESPRHPGTARRRVVITGAGVVSALGNSPPEFHRSLQSGQAGIVCQPDTELLRAVGAAAFDATAHFSRLELLSLDRGTQFALVASEQAMHESGVTLAPDANAGVYWGTGGGGFETIEASYGRFYGAAPGGSGGSGAAMTVPAAMVHAPAAQVSIRHGVRGECLTYSTACSSASVAIGEAFLRIALGLRDVAIAGGSECALLPGVLKGWLAMRVLCDDPREGIPSGCRPFDRDRQGFALGEGAAAFVLESYEHAMARGAEVLAELVGYGASNDASHITRPDGAGQIRAMTHALACADIAPSDVSYINAHGTGTPFGDAVECASIAAVFGESAQRIPISSTKAAHGHLLGASGAIEMLACLYALRMQCVPPTLNWVAPDPATADWDFVPNVGRPANLRHVMSNSFAFGGNNAVLIARRWPG